MKTQIYGRLLRLSDQNLGPKWVKLTSNGTNPGIFFQIRFSTFVTQSEVGRSLSDIPTDVSSSKADNGVEIS